SRRSSVVFPQPEGPRSVTSSPSPILSSTRSTAVTAPNRFTTAAMSIFTTGRKSAARERLLLLQLVPLRFNVRTELGLERLGPLGRGRLIVDVRHLVIEVGADAARELDGHLC